MKLYFVTRNESKFKEASSILKNVSIELVKISAELKEPKSLGQREVVLEKARQAYESVKAPLIVDDTAIYFKAIPGFPGAITKDLFQRIGFEGVQKLLTGLSKEAYFRTMICYKDEKECKIFSGICKGIILTEKSEKFNPDWPYNSIFVPNGFSKTLSEMTDGEREMISHRRKALEKIMKYFGGDVKNEKN